MRQTLLLLLATFALPACTGTVGEAPHVDAAGSRSDAGVGRDAAIADGGGPADGNGADVTAPPADGNGADVTVPPPTCSDGACNGTETCVTCPSDCGMCVAPTCTDMIRNGAETGVDCGGPDCAACDVVELADYYVSPDGSDTNPGTLAAPFATWRKLNEVLRPGQLAYIRGGTYHVAVPMAPDFEERWSMMPPVS